MYKKYLNKEPINAIRFKDDWATYNFICDEIKCMLRAKDEAEYHANKHYGINIMGVMHRQVLFIGDYLAKTKEGMFYVIRKDIMKSTYDELSDTASIYKDLLNNFPNINSDIGQGLFSKNLTNIIASPLGYNGDNINIPEGVSTPSRVLSHWLDKIETISFDRDKESINMNLYEVQIRKVMNSIMFKYVYKCKGTGETKCLDYFVYDIDKIDTKTYSGTTGKKLLDDSIADRYEVIAMVQYINEVLRIANDNRIHIPSFEDVPVSMFISYDEPIKGLDIFGGGASVTVTFRNLTLSLDLLNKGGNNER